MTDGVGCSPIISNVPHATTVVQLSEYLSTRHPSACHWDPFLYDEVSTRYKDQASLFPPKNKCSNTERQIMDIRPIRTDEDYKSALQEIETLWEAPEGTPEADKMEVLAILVEDYENRHFTIGDDLSPVEVLRLAMAEMGHTQAELSALLGSRSRTSEILAGKRGLNTDAVYRISKAWRIPAELLIEPRSPRRAA
jgi:HTH-type transcriptional regulator / antitoxin HigA